LSNIFILFGYLLKPFTEIWRFFKKIDQNMAIENLKKKLILALNIFHITFWLYRASDKKAASQPFLLLAMYSQKAILKIKSS
jgi:hypothetical protein